MHGLRHVMPLPSVANLRCKAASHGCRASLGLEASVLGALAQEAGPSSRRMVRTGWRAHASLSCVQPVNGGCAATWAARSARPIGDDGNGHSEPVSCVATPLAVRVHPRCRSPCHSVLSAVCTHRAAGLSVRCGEDNCTCRAPLRRISYLSACAYRRADVFAVHGCAQRWHTLAHARTHARRAVHIHADWKGPAASDFGRALCAPVSRARSRRDRLDGLRRGERRTQPCVHTAALSHALDPRCPQG